ncbi:hypothetical protein [Exiguobacterium mexicanum]
MTPKSIGLILLMVILALGGGLALTRDKRLTIQSPSLKEQPI